MNAGVGTAPDCLSLAIAFHQAPSRFPDLLHGRAPLPDHVGVLLRLAGGAPLDDDAPVAPSLFDPEEVKSAAQFFVEQVLLAHDADHYRILGVSPGASLEEIREHHRLLMRIFHPDRGDNLGGAKDAIATRINLAYSALRDPSERAAYDLEKRLATKKAVTPHVGELRRTARMEPPGHGLPPFLARNLPQFVLGATALAAVAVVGWIYLNRQPVGAIGGGEGEVERITYRKPPPAVQEEPAAPRLSLTQSVGSPGTELEFAL